MGITTVSLILIVGISGSKSKSKGTKYNSTVPTTSLENGYKTETYLDRN